MSDNINEVDSQTGLEMAWHGKTNVVEKITKENSGINYEMEKRPLYRKNKEGILVPSNKNFELVCLDNDYPIGQAVGKDYGDISNPKMWDMVMEALSGTDHKIVSTGSVEDRTKVFISIKIDDSFKAANRVTDSTLNIVWGHAGKLSIMGKSGITVIVCANTLTLALSEKGEFIFKVKHTKFCNLKLENMGQAIENHIGVAKEFKEAMDQLANNSCSPSRAENIYAGFIAPPQDKELSTRTKNTINRLSELFIGGKGNRGDNESDLFNGFTDYYTHESSGGENRWKQFVSSEFGMGTRKKTEFYDLLTKGRNQLKEIEKRGELLLKTN